MAVNPTVAEPSVTSGGTYIPEVAPSALTPGELAWRRFRKHRMALIGGIGATLLVLFIVVGSIIVPESQANSVDLVARLAAPTAVHWFGTDSVGRDVFYR